MAPHLRRSMIRRCIRRSAAASASSKKRIGRPLMTTECARLCGPFRTVRRRSRAMKIGVFDHMDRANVPLDQFFDDRMKLVEAYDRAGFHGYHVAEHHSTPLGVAPSPGVWLAAIAARTKQLRFGALVYLLPLYHPIKLLEELCMLDQMSHGRVMFGVGRGISPIELRYYDLNPDETPAMYAEALEVILQGLTSPTLTHEG